MIMNNRSLVATLKRFEINAVIGTSLNTVYANFT